MPVPHAWVSPDGRVSIVSMGHWEQVPRFENFENMYERGYLRIGGFGGYTRGEYTNIQKENFVQGPAEYIAMHKAKLDAMLVPGEHVRIAFYERGYGHAGVAWLSTEEFWDADIESEARKAKLFPKTGVVARRPAGVRVRRYWRRR